MNIRCTQNIYKSANCVSSITYYIMVPEGVSLCGVVQISHDICDYFTRYTSFARYLCSLGFVVCGNDNAGHGASALKSSDLGFFGAKDGWCTLVDDTMHLMQLMRKRYPDLPYFMYGHGVGSLVVRMCMIQPTMQLSGVILSATLSAGPYDATSIHVADSIARAHGATYRSAFLNNRYFKSVMRKRKDCKSIFDWISRDDKVVTMYGSDEKCNFPLTSAAFRDLYTLTVRANSTQAFRRTPSSLPMLFLTGDQDAITHFGESVRRVVATYRSLGSYSIDVIFYKGARHDILNELNRFDVFGDISRWLTHRLENPGAITDETVEVLAQGDAMNEAPQA